MVSSDRLVYFLISSIALWGLFWLVWRRLVPTIRKKKLFLGGMGFTFFVALYMAGIIIRPLTVFESAYADILYAFSLFSAAWMAALGISLAVLLGMGIIKGLNYSITKTQKKEFHESRRDFLKKAALGVPLFVLGGTGVMTVRGDSGLEANHHQLVYDDLPDQLQGYKIAQISDVHMGTYFDMEKWDYMMQRILAEKPQRLVITGDLIDDLDFLPILCRRLEDDFDKFPHGIDYILGNHEYFRNLDAILRAFKPLKMRVLCNENYLMLDGQKPIYLAGVEYPIKSLEKDNREVLLEKALKNIPPEAFTILLAHHPHFIVDGFEKNISLILTGHSHGGQINFFGQPVLPFSYPYWRGLHKENNKYGFVSTGTGHWFPLRINCPREVTFFTFKSQ